MPSTSTYRKPPRTPPGCEDHLTRQQAAQLLGFSSEFKVRQLEREGRLQAVRGPMRTAFYARADVLAVKAQLGRDGLGQEPSDGWTDAELLLLLRHPNREGRQRTALDLVLETRISIERAERVFAFWSGSQVASAAPAPRPQFAGGEADASRATTPVLQAPKAATEDTAIRTSAAPAKLAPTEPPAPEAFAPAGPPQPAGPPAVVALTNSERPSTDAQQAAAPEGAERRGEDRLSRDALLAQLRDPDPRVRDRAFTLLRALQAGR